MEYITDDRPVIALEIGSLECARVFATGERETFVKPGDTNELYESHIRMLKVIAAAYTVELDDEGQYKYTFHMERRWLEWALFTRRVRAEAQHAAETMQEIRERATVGAFV